MASFPASQSKQFIFFLFVVCVLFQFPSCLVLTGPLLSSLPSTQSFKSHIGTTSRCYSSHGFQVRLCLVLFEESCCEVWLATRQVFELPPWRCLPGWSQTRGDCGLPPHQLPLHLSHQHSRPGKQQQDRGPWNIIKGLAALIIMLGLFVLDLLLHQMSNCLPAKSTLSC